jgi:hypothetical protein
MDEEDVSILPVQGTPKQVHSSNKLAYSYTSDSDETMQSHDQDATMERWIPVSSKKKRSKQAQKSDTASDHKEADPWQSTPEQLDYPQPVSKRISIGIPTNPYVISKEKQLQPKTFSKHIQMIATLLKHQKDQVKMDWRVMSLIPIFS